MPSMAAFGGNESCPNCSARMAPDQRYCLNCGHRRGDPRLPFMDAVVFMESMNSAPGGAGTPPPPPAQPSGGPNNKWNANAALIAGVATLVLAIGVGFLIGRTGHNDNGSAGNGGGEVKVVQIGGGTGGEVAATPEEAETSGASETASKGGKGNKGGGSKEPAIKAEGKKATPKAEKNSQKGAHGQTEGVEKALHTSSGVELAEPEQELGGSCKEGQAGCQGGEFKGNFFE
jgi:hypothetical protein